MEPIYPNNFDNCTETEDTFDLQFSTRPLRMLKIITPFLPADIQPGIAMMIRLQELKHTMKQLRTGSATSPLFAAESNIHTRSAQTLSDLFSPEILNPILQKLSPLLLPKERKELAKIQQLLQMLETYKQLEPYISMFTQAASAFSPEESATAEYTESEHADSSTRTDPESANSGASNSVPGFSPDMLMGMLSPDMLQNLGGLMQLFAPGTDSPSSTET